MNAATIATLPLSALMGSAYRITLASFSMVWPNERGDPDVVRVCIAGELAQAHPKLHTFRVPEIAELLRRGDLAPDVGALWQAIFAALSTGGSIEVNSLTVEQLLAGHPAISEDEVKARWKRWGREARACYVALRQAGLRWLGDPESMRQRMLVASWAADRVEVLH